jgi:hypothetical protein
VISTSAFRNIPASTERVERMTASDPRAALTAARAALVSGARKVRTVGVIWMAPC